MVKAAVFTMKLEADLRAQFIAAAEASHRPASQIVRELMRDFVDREQRRQAHAVFLQGKVDAARASIVNGQGRANEDVEADFASRRTRALEHG